MRDAAARLGHVTCLGAPLSGAGLWPATAPIVASPDPTRADVTKLWVV
ncbi:hypothetical protein GFS60_07267 (plasmid) [Rhodococcus sp. WAY2]|nr:hypothetical protein GFS60_07267 [Rhodococcus sp. WAY2]